jgi:hypothetical protein
MMEISLAWKCSFFLFLAAPIVSALDLNYYYTDDGGYTNSCPFAKCPSCTTGHFRSACGNTGGTVPEGQLASDGNCQQCTLKPANSVYDSYPSAGTFSDAACPWSCNAGYSKSGSACVLNACPALSDSTKEYTTGPPSCEFVCKAGYSGTTANNPATCTICGPGTFALEGSSTCTPCTAGYKQPNQGQSSCSECPAGSYSNAGAATCTPCTPGTANGQLAQSSCPVCNAGSYSAQGASQCTLCNPGYYSSSSGASECTPCPKGTFGSTSGLTACPWCDSVSGVPQYSLTTSSIACTPCAVCTSNGKFRDNCGRDSAGDCITCSN